MDLSIRLRYSLAMSCLKNSFLNLRSRGFSLIELLVTIAIIGIISVIAADKFGGYLRKGKIVEAKVMLAGLYGQEKVYFFEEEKYNSNLAEIKLNFTGEYIYNVGFENASSAMNRNTFEVCGYCFGDGSCSEKGSPYGTDCKLTDEGRKDQVKKLLGGGDCKTTGNKQAKVGFDADGKAFFLAIACADLGGDKLDVWSINQRRQLIHGTDGTK